MHVWQKGIPLPVSNIRVQMRQGAGKMSEASASHIPRKLARRELAARPKVSQAYANHQHKGSKIWHDSCQLQWRGLQPGDPTAMAKWLHSLKS